MNVEVKEETDLVVCNANNLEVQKASVTVANGEQLEAVVSNDAEQQTLSLKLGKLNRLNGYLGL